MSLIEQGDKPEPPSIAWKSNDVTLDTLSTPLSFETQVPAKNYLPFPSPEATVSHWGL